MNKKTQKQHKARARRLENVKNYEYLLQNFDPPYFVNDEMISREELEVKLKIARKDIDNINRRLGFLI